VLRVTDPEVDVGPAPSTELNERVLDAGDPFLHEAIEEPECLLADGPDEFVLVREVEVDRRRRDADGGRYCPDRDRFLVAGLGE
jgi:hypothetical protein